MSANSYFLFYCRKPAKVMPFSPRSGTEQMFIEGIPVYTGLPPWPACADVLHNLAGHEFLGLSYLVAPDDLPLVTHLYAGLDGDAVRLLKPDSADMKDRYQLEYGQNARLEIVWHPRMHMAVRILELMEPLWYYSLGNERVPHGEVVAIGISKMDELLTEYGLSLPANYLTQ